MSTFGNTISGEKTFTIAAAADGSAVAAVDLGANYAMILVYSTDLSKVDASTALTALVGYDDSDTLVDLYTEDDPSTLWSKSAIPATGTMAFFLRSAAGARQLRLVISNVANGGSVVFKVRGMGGAV